MATVYLAATSDRFGALPITIVDGEPSTTGYVIRGVDLGNPSFDKTYSGQRGTQGAMLAGEVAQNRLSTFRLLVTGTSMDDLHRKLTVLWQLDEEFRRFGGTLTWRPWGSSYRMSIDVLDSAITLEGLEPELFVSNYSAHVVFAVTSPPYMRGEPFDIVDDFTRMTNNLLPNGSFELTTNGWSAGPSWFTVAGGTLGRTLSRFLYGGASSFFTLPGGTVNQGMYAPVTVVAGTTYTFSAWLQHNVVGQTRTLRIGIGGALTSSVTTDVIVTEATWTRAALTFTPPVSGNIEVAVVCPGSTAFNFHVDGAKLEVGATATPFDDPSAPYTFDAGTSAEATIENGVLNVLSGNTTEKRLIHTGRGYLYGDQQATVKSTPGATIASHKTGVVLKRIDANNYLEVYVDDNGTNSRLRIDKVVAGARTNLSTANLVARIANGVAFWVRGRIEGITVIAEYFTGAPSPAATSTLTGNVTLAGADITVFGWTVRGAAGFSWIPQTATATIDDFAVEPYTYRMQTLPVELQLAGTIPGDASALASAVVTPSGGSATPIWAALGWWRRSAAYNQCWNGDFENTALGTQGWATAAVANMLSAPATSIARITTAAKYGSSSLQIVCPATSATGASFRIFDRFKKGITYTFEAWVHAATATTVVDGAMGNSAANDVIGSSFSVTLSTAWQRVTGTWTPSADRDDAHVAFRIGANTATTWEIDGVMVYEGTVAPTSANQSEGRGGFPPLGIIEAENSFGTYTTQTGATYRSGFGIVNTTPQTTVQLVVDPALLTPDDYTQGEVAIEVWMRALYASNAPGVVILSAVPITATAGMPAIYTEEFGSVGRVVQIPSSSTVFRFARLGTLRLPTNAGRYIVTALCGTSGNAFNPVVDYLMFLPAASRALSPSGRAADTSFPQFVSATTEITRVIRSDLSGALFEPATGAQVSAAPGLGGSLLEFPAADADAVVKLSSLVPDDPTLPNATAEQLSHAATVHFAVTPRWRLNRSS